MAVQKLKQCPYEAATKCAMDEPCEGCETWAHYLKEQKDKIVIGGTYFCGGCLSFHSADENCKTKP